MLFLSFNYTAEDRSRGQVSGFGNFTSNDIEPKDMNSIDEITGVLQKYLSDKYPEFKDIHPVILFYREM